MLQAFFWIALYGIVFTVFRALSEPMAAVAMSTFVVVLLVWLFKTGRSEYICLQKPKIDGVAKKTGSLVLLLLPICNVITRQNLSISIYTLAVISAAVCEEILFRGVLLKWLAEKGRIKAIVFSSLMFAVLHIVNIADTQQIVGIVLQICVAFSAGVLYAVTVFEYKSVIPCITSHCLVNLTAGSGQAEVYTAETVLLLICSAMHIIYAIIIYSTRKRVDNER